VPRDVFEEHPFGLAFPDDPGHVGPQMAGVGRTFSLARRGKRLAWVSGKHGIDDAAPWQPAESLDVVPDRGGGEVSGALGSDEGAARVFVIFDEAGGGKARLGKLKTHVKSAAACTEGQALSGR